MINSMYDATSLQAQSSTKIVYVQAIEFLTQIKNQLEKQQDVQNDSKTVNDVLSQLVKQLCNWASEPSMQALVHHPQLGGIAKSLPLLCSHAEYELEKWWINRLLNTKGSIWHAINDYWYIKHYEALVDVEMQLIQKQAPEHLAFIKCGAFPISALLMAQRLPQATIRCIDSDPEACQAARVFIQRCGLQNRITVEECDVQDFSPKCDEIIMLASALRVPYLYEKLHAQGTKRLIIRDVEGIFKFLYQPAPLPPRRLFRETSRTQNCNYRCNISRYYTVVK